MSEAYNLASVMRGKPRSIYTISKPYVCLVEYAGVKKSNVCKLKRPSGSVTSGRTIQEAGFNMFSI